MLQRLLYVRDTVVADRTDCNGKRKETVRRLVNAPEVLCIQLTRFTRDDGLGLDNEDELEDEIENPCQASESARGVGPRRQSRAA